MPEGKICPLFLIFYKTSNNTCIKSECELWSTETSMCSIFMGMNAILSVADALRGISENIKTHFPE
ncbi:unnamed protein product [marine sediment metagenome]|uniref:Uncharacterized protein n=1 Tax=marine sediment metagenome TaxID=412755 RepID=X1VRP3_9ZZZZ